MLPQRVRVAESRAKNKSSNGPLRVQSNAELFELIITYGFERYLSATALLKIFEIASIPADFCFAVTKISSFKTALHLKRNRLRAVGNFFSAGILYVWQREKCPNVREILCFKHMKLLIQKVIRKVFCNVSAYVSCRGYVGILQSARFFRESRWHHG